MDETIMSAFMISPDSPRKAFYNLILSGDQILKVSGITYPEKKVLDKRVIPFDDRGKAVAFFKKKVREKSKAGRKRVYCLL